MKTLYVQVLALLLFGSGMLQSCQKEEQGKEVGQEAILVFSKTAGFRHESIEAGIDAIQALAQEHQVKVTATENAAYFVSDSLKHYKAVVFLNTTGDVLDPAQQTAFEQYILDTSIENENIKL
ncbi:ThuA domain-containing protein [Pontibacter qinzhouensis]|uniref:ThuA domain-containing protein n=1 Tax=Pontibacter qinzhouensis TaxID=2603253 RepID=A0A5C8K4P3_9BACT|nr:ThuA domain-containing protein [Pontibacter qinzhouensis]TXK44840.1 ThuA domain-containing protein [Pontibacter qinzhouensis]